MKTLFLTIVTFGSLLVGCEQQAPQLSSDEKRRQEWQVQRAALLQKSEQAATPEEGRAILAKYIYIGDKDALALYHKHELALLRAKAQDDAAESIEERVNRRKRILHLAPDDPDVTKQLAKLEAERAKQEAKQAARLAQLKAMGTASLCSALRKNPDSDEYLDEFLRRGGRDKDISYVLKREVALGMSEWGVVCAWGVPEDVNTTIFSGGTHKQFVYSSSYVYTENNEVTSIQQ